MISSTPAVSLVLVRDRQKRQRLVRSPLLSYYCLFCLSLKLRCRSSTDPLLRLHAAPYIFRLQLMSSVLCLTHIAYILRARTHTHTHHTHPQHTHRPAVAPSRSNSSEALVGASQGNRAFIESLCNTLIVLLLYLNRK